MMLNFLILREAGFFIKSFQGIFTDHEGKISFEPPELYSPLNLSLILINRCVTVSSPF